DRAPKSIDFRIASECVAAKHFVNAWRTNGETRQNLAYQKMAYNVATPFCTKLRRELDQMTHSALCADAMGVVDAHSLLGDLRQGVPPAAASGGGHALTASGGATNVEGPPNAAWWTWESNRVLK
ncbi:unnamed protein product, partial [Amoebophrya sp. A25]